MRAILFLSCSPRGAESISSAFAQVVLERLRLHAPDALVEHRDLAADPPPLAGAAFASAVLNPAAGPEAFGPSEALIAQLERADAVVLATPMHNYTVPAPLKAWIDQVVRIRRSFAGTPSGKVGLLPDRPVFLVVASGGWFTAAAPAGTPPQPDFLTPYLRAIFATIGITSLHVLTLEGATRGPDHCRAAWDRASAELDGLVTPR